MLLMNLTLLQSQFTGRTLTPSVMKELKELRFYSTLSRDVSSFSPLLPPYLIVNLPNKFLVSNLVKQDECILGCIRSIVKD